MPASAAVRPTLGRIIEKVLLHVEGSPGTRWARVHDTVAADHAEESVSRTIASTITAGFLTSVQTPDGARLWITTRGLALLHGADYDAPGVL